MRRAARARLLSVGRLLLFGRRLLGRQSWSAAVGGVEPRHRFTEVADARVAAAVAMALEDADEAEEFFHTDQDWKTVKLTVWPVVSWPRVNPMNAEYSASEWSDA